MGRRQSPDDDKEIVNEFMDDADVSKRARRVKLMATFFAIDVAVVIAIIYFVAR
jgi:hypothetical protein